MSKISTYPSAETPLLLSDRLIGTEAIRPTPSPTPLATKNFSLGELLQLFSANFPAASLQAVLNTGNTATQDIELTGTISSTLMKPINIEDTSGSQGTTFQFLSKGTSSINWVNLPVDNLQAVLNAGNTATQNITLIGNVTSTRVIPGNIQDDTASIGTTGQVLSKTASGIRWINNPTVTTPGLADVLSVGNIATNNITLIGDINATNAKITGSIYDSNNSPGTAGQILSSTVTGTDWIDLSISGYVPYVGATSNLDLNTKNIFANEFNFWDPAYSLYGSIHLDAEEFFFKTTPTDVVARITYGSTFLTGIGFSAQLVYTGLTANRVYTLPNASGTIALTSDIPTAVTSVSATSPITSSGGTTPTISTSMATNKLIGRSTAGTGVMEEITIGTGLTLSAGTLSATATGGGIPHATASGTDTYTATVTGVTSYADGDAYLIRFTNGNTTGATLNINALGAIPLYRNNDGALIGGDIWAGAEMLCVYNSTLNIFQCIGTSSNSLFAYVTNADSVAITKGQPVYAFGGTGDRLTVKRALNTSDATSAQTVGVVLTSSIAVNQKGIIIIQGLLDGLSILPTSTWADGDPVYLGTTAGSITNVKQYAPNHLVYLGTVTNASNGSAGRWYVRVQNGYELDELHNVQAQTPSLKDTLWYDSGVTPGQWKTASISTILGYTPFNLPSLTSGSVLFSNGTTIAQDNANFFWDDSNNRLGIGTNSPSAALHVNGSMYLQNLATGIESITFSSGPLINNDGPSGIFKSGEVYTNTINGRVGVATTTPATALDVNGVITATGGNSTSWNAKQDAITLTTTGTSGPATLVGATLNIPQYSGGGGGGLQGIHALISLTSGSQTSSSMQGATSGTGNNFNANRLLAYPFIPAQSFTSSNLQINITVAAAGSLCRIAVYSDLDGVPDTSIFISSDLDCSTAGLKTATTSISFVAGTTYWLAFHGGGTVSATTQLLVAQTIPLKYVNVSSISNFLFRSLSFGGGTPSSFGSPISYTSGNVPTIFITKA